MAVSTIWLEVGNAMTSLTLLAEKLRVNVFLNQFQRLYQIFGQRFDWNECKYKQWT